MDKKATIYIALLTILCFAFYTQNLYLKKSFSHQNEKKVIAEITKYTYILEERVDEAQRLLENPEKVSTEAINIEADYLDHSLYQLLKSLNKLKSYDQFSARVNTIIEQPSLLSELYIIKEGIYNAEDKSIEELKHLRQQLNQCEKELEDAMEIYKGSDFDLFLKKIGSSV